MAEKLKKSQLYTFGVGGLCFTLLATMELFYFTAFLTDFAAAVFYFGYRIEDKHVLQMQEDIAAR
jgi:hypothetical protein